MVKLYVCGRCGYRSHHRMRCHSCGFMLEEECVKCYSAKGNCVCKLHGAFVGGKKMRKRQLRLLRRKSAQKGKRGNN